ncbi:hypothetical protein MAR_013266 [Mya arenaria]|uniref:Uncharacterized protein n=1 Tax=Mya arenaria TaxID=6604 RepID=A0ABY7FZF3_MYAAR|nr:hypothetical protein MAR_013266 [Mya arenaria]
MLRYNDRSLAAVAFMIAYVAFMSLLLLPSVPPRLVWILHFLSLPAVALSRLSATSAFLCIFQGVGRLATSALSTGDVIMTLTFTVASLLNVLLFVQVMVYRRRLKKASFNIEPGETTIWPTGKVFVRAFGHALRKVQGHFINELFSQDGVQVIDEPSLLRAFKQMLDSSGQRPDPKSSSSSSSSSSRPAVRPTATSPPPAVA